MVVYNFKKIQTVPGSNDFVDIVLTRTQRKTPTVIHPSYAISRIRAFYMRKVKFTQATFQEKLSQIINDFPRLDDIHPFYRDLINILYDRDHYKLALGQINTCRALIDNIAKDHVRMLKYGDSLYRCKQLKRAALGRMCTLMKKQKSSLEYLEEVRKHLSRLPSIDPNTRTLLVTGFPNVGKSSFMNKVTRADVDVQPYAFTTKALYVGHMDYKYLRWQVIDTPGILDHPLEQRNTIEMQAVTALAHLQASVLFFCDVSEQCGFSIEQQLSLFDSVRPLFANKPLIFVANKVDQVKFEDLPMEKQEAINKSCEEAKAIFMTMSNHSEENVSAVKHLACDKLLEHRVDSKIKGKKLTDVMNRLTVTLPNARDTKKRGPVIPQSVLDLGDTPTVSTRKTQRDIQVEKGGAGVYYMPFEEHYTTMLKNSEWSTDAIPEIWNGKNIADFIDPEIMQRLEELEREEEAMEADVDMQADDDFSDLDDDAKEKLRLIRDKKGQMINAHRQEKNHNHGVVPRKAKKRTIVEYKAHLDSLGVDTSNLKHAEKIATDRAERGRKRTRDPADEMETDGDELATSRGRSKSRLRSKSRAPRDESGFAHEEMKEAAVKVERKNQRKRNKMARAGEGDHQQTVKLIKWQLAGKRGNGNTNCR